MGCCKDNLSRFGNRYWCAKTQSILLDKSKQNFSGIIAILGKNQIWQITFIHFFLKSTGVPRPSLNIAPIPEQDPSELDDGLGKLGVAPAPVMDQVGSFDVQALSNLSCAH